MFSYSDESKIQAFGNRTLVEIFRTKREKCVVFYNVNSERNIASNVGKLKNFELEGKQKEVVVKDNKLLSRHSSENLREKHKIPRL